MSASHSPNWKYLEPRPKASYRQLYVKGTRIRARVLYGWYMNEEDPLTPEQLAAEFNLPLEAVQEAIAYCESNPPEIEQDFLREEALLSARGINDADLNRSGKGS